MPTEDFEQAQYLSTQVEQARQRAVLAASDAVGSHQGASAAEFAAREYAKKAERIVHEADKNVAGEVSKAVQARNEAQAAAVAAELSANLVEAPADTAVARLLSHEESETRQVLTGFAVPIKNDLVKIGKSSLAAQTDKNRNAVAIGQNTMRNMVDADKSVAIGTNAMADGKHSLDNVGIGDGALKSVESLSSDYSQSSMEGTRNVGIGGNAGRFVGKGAAHTLIGRNAGQNVAGAQGVVAIGNGAHASRCPVGLSGTVENWAPLGLGLTTTANVVAIGNWAASRNSDLDILAVGAYALTSATKSKKNTAIGSSSMRRIDQAKWIDGSNVVTLNLTGTYVHSGNQLTLEFPSAHGAIVGDVAIFRLTDGGSKTFAEDLVFAEVVTVISPQAMEVVHPKTGNAAGGAILNSVSKQSETPTYSNENTALGAETLAFFDGGGANTAAGTYAARNIKKGGNNVALGHNALRGISESAEIAVSDNTAVGQAALYEASDGMAGHTALGYRAGLNLRSGADNTFVGRLAGSVDVAGAALQTASNSTALGAGSRVSGSNQVQLGNSATTTYVYGTVQNRSDQRDKADVRDTVLGLEFITQLRPVDYKWDMREDYEDFTPDGSKKRSRFHHGLIAQEVAKVIESTGQDFGGFQDHSIGGGSDVLSIGYDELIAPIIKSIQQINERLITLEEAV